MAPKKAEWWKLPNANAYRQITSNLFLEGMASCTAITYVNKKLIGDPLDVSMFEATGWIMKEPDSNTQENEDQLVIAYTYPSEIEFRASEVTFASNSASQSNIDRSDSDLSNHVKVSLPYKNALIRRFDFSSGLQRMSVLCKNQIDN